MALDFSKLNSDVNMLASKDLGSSATRSQLSDARNDTLNDLAKNQNFDEKKVEANKSDAESELTRNAGGSSAIRNISNGISDFNNWIGGGIDDLLVDGLVGNLVGAYNQDWGNMIKNATTGEDLSMIPAIAEAVGASALAGPAGGMIFGALASGDDLANAIEGKDEFGQNLTDEQRTASGVNFLLDTALGGLGGGTAKAARTALDDVAKEGAEKVLGNVAPDAKKFREAQAAAQKAYGDAGLATAEKAEARKALAEANKNVKQAKDQFDAAAPYENIINGELSNAQSIDDILSESNIEKIMDSTKGKLSDIESNYGKRLIGYGEKVGKESATNDALANELNKKVLDGTLTRADMAKAVDRGILDLGDDATALFKEGVKDTKSPGLLGRAIQFGKDSVPMLALGSADAVANEVGNGVSFDDAITNVTQNPEALAAALLARGGAGSALRRGGFTNKAANRITNLAGAQAMGGYGNNYVGVNPSDEKSGITQDEYVNTLKYLYGVR